VKHSASKPKARVWVESPGKPMVTRTTSSKRRLALAAGRVLGHTIPVEERGRRLRGRYVWASRVQVWEAARQARRRVWLPRSISLNWEALRLSPGPARVCVWSIVPKTDAPGLLVRTTRTLERSEKWCLNRKQVPTVLWVWTLLPDCRGRGPGPERDSESPTRAAGTTGWVAGQDPHPPGRRGSGDDDQRLPALRLVRFHPLLSDLTRAPLPANRCNALWKYVASGVGQKPLKQLENGQVATRP